jgi:hypothetical protein
MRELNFSLLISGFTQNFNIVDLVKFLEIFSETSHLDRSGHNVTLKVTSCRTMSKRKK